jgi:hypothetical protein
MTKPIATLISTFERRIGRRQRRGTFVRLRSSATGSVIEVVPSALIVILPA